MAVQTAEHPAAAFAAHGFLTGLRAHDAAGADRVRRHFDALEAAEGRDRCQIGLQDRHLDQRFVWELAAHSAILDAVSAVLGPDVLLLATHFFCKYPGVTGDEVTGDGEGLIPSPLPTAWAPARHPSPLERYVAWHQDVTYWGLEPPLAVTAWYAVDDSDVENGCMRVIPGSHRGGIRAHGTADRPGNLLSINQQVPVTEAEGASAVDLALRAGEFSLHHGMLIHGSNPNRSARRRCGLTLRYVPTHVRQVAPNSHGRRYRALLVRGEDRHGHFPAPPLPFPLPE